MNLPSSSAYRDPSPPLDAIVVEQESGASAGTFVDGPVDFEWELRCELGLSESTREA